MNKKAIIYGAGNKGQSALLDLKNRYGIDTVCFIDENENIQGKQILDTPVVSLEDGVDLALLHNANIYIALRTNNHSAVQKLKRLGYKRYKVWNVYSTFSILKTKNKISRICDRSFLTLKKIFLKVDLFFCRISKKKSVVLHVCSEGQIQFILPILRKSREKEFSDSLVCYFASRYKIQDAPKKTGLPFWRCINDEESLNSEKIDFFLQTEIYGRGPIHSKKIFIGHGQPNKITNWSEDNLRSFEYYFLYGELEKEMFLDICSKNIEATAHIKTFEIGYPKLDDQINGAYDTDAIRKRLGLDPSKKVILYAPAWDPGCSLREYGQEIVKVLLGLDDVYVLVKLHPVSMEPVYSPYFEFYTGGVVWKNNLGVFDDNPRYRFIDEQLVNPVLSISDILVTDFSGIALEFMLLDRPVLYIDCPKFYNETLKKWGCDSYLSKNDDRYNAGRNYGEVVYDLSELSHKVLDALKNPNRLSAKRSIIRSRFIYNPGSASEATLREVLCLSR